MKSGITRFACSSASLNGRLSLNLKSRRIHQIDASIR